MKILITGGAGFIGSHAAEFYANKGDEVIVFDNLSRNKLLKKDSKDSKNADYNWNYLKKFKNITLIKGDVTNFEQVKSASSGCDAIFHLAAQTAVTTSVTDPIPDFYTNALGTFNVLEAARLNNVKAVIYSSTNKVFGNNVNNVGLIEEKKKYLFEKKFAGGIPENFNIDLDEHTPYGCSKLTGDLYVQDYAHQYGIRTGVFRMSCIYGTRQFGVEDQGWVAWFTIATVLGKPLTIYGDGKQVRDVLYVSDLIELYDTFLKSKLKHGVFNTGGGPENTLSLIELLELLENYTKKKSQLSYDNWRPSDQKVYVSDITKAKEILGWKPKVTPEEGVKKLVEWTTENKALF